MFLNIAILPHIQEEGLRPRPGLLPEGWLQDGWPTLTHIKLRSSKAAVQAKDDVSEARPA
jgi:hypothetical protein